jgi:hypothetical protein
MAIFTSYEHIDNDAGKVLNRLMQYLIQGALHPSVHPNILVQTGLNDPRRDPAQPYVGPSSFYWPGKIMERDVRGNGTCPSFSRNLLNFVG